MVAVPHSNSGPNLPPREEVSHNLAGQRLGRKGQETRERIIAALLRIVEDPQGPPLTLTSVAREAAVRLPNLYLYFPDFAELLLAALRRVMESDAEFLELLRTRWPDDRLGECVLEFLRSYLNFWRRHTRLLHLRNKIADEDVRVLEYRRNATRPLLDLLTFQMDCLPDQTKSAGYLLATAVLTGFERLATVVSNPNYRVGLDGYAGDEEFVDELFAAEGRLVALAIRDEREAQRRGGN